MEKKEAHHAPTCIYAECDSTRQRCQAGEVNALPDHTRRVLNSILDSGAAALAALIERTRLPVNEALASAEDLVRRGLLQRGVVDPDLHARMERLLAQQHAAYDHYVQTRAGAKAWTRLARRREQAQKKRQAEIRLPIVSRAGMPTSTAAVAAVPTSEPAVHTDMKRAQRQAQDQAIIDALSSMRLNPKALPRYENGMPGVKAELKGSIGREAPFKSILEFDNTWLRLLRRGKLGPTKMKT